MHPNSPDQDQPACPFEEYSRAPLPEARDELPTCIECLLILRAVPLNDHEIYYSCRGCHMGFTISAENFGNRPLPPEFEHCKHFQQRQEKIDVERI